MFRVEYKVPSELLVLAVAAIEVEEFCEIEVGVCREPEEVCPGEVLVGIKGLNFGAK